MAGLPTTRIEAAILSVKDIGNSSPNEPGYCGFFSKCVIDPRSSDKNPMARFMLCADEEKHPKRTSDVRELYHVLLRHAATPYLQLFLALT